MVTERCSKRWWAVRTAAVFTVCAGTAAAVAPVRAAHRVALTRGRPPVALGSSAVATRDAYIRDFGISVDLGPGENLVSLTLRLDDKSIGPPGPPARFGENDSAIPLLWSATGGGTACAAPFVKEPTAGGGTRYRSTFGLPLWVPGDNALRVEAVARSAGGGTHLATREARFRLEGPASGNRGIARGPDGRLGTSFWAGVPIFVANCLPGVFCKDADQDGLDDFWENAAVEALRPWLAHDQAEKLFEHPGHQVRVFVRVTPFQRVGSSDRYVIFRHIVAYSKDYGTDVAFAVADAHRGDTERFETAWRVHNGTTIHLAAAWSHGHGPWLGSDFDQGEHALDRIELAADGAIKVYIEEDKHGTWISQDACNDQGRYDCHARANHTIRPSAVNVGEPTSDSARPWARALVDRMSAVQRPGPHEGIFGAFPTEAVFSPADRTRYRGSFCGGLGAEEGCANQIAEMLGRPWPPGFTVLSGVFPKYRLVMEQADRDRDGHGDACDAYPLDPRRH